MRLHAEGPSMKRWQIVSGAALVAALAWQPQALAAAAFDATLDDQAVVQRGALWRLGGTSDGSAPVAVLLGGRRFEARRQGGRWTAEIAVPKDLAGTVDLALDGGSDRRRVLVGDVWLCAGQSNMAMPTRKVEDADAIEAGIAGQPLRLLKVLPPTGQRAAAVAQPWQAASADSARAFSAVCLAFGKELQQRTGVPIGLVDASLGGTRIEAWISATGLPAAAARDTAYQRLMDRADRDPEAAGAFDKNRASIVFESMIQGLTTLPLRGVLWYQGESNRINAASYAALLGTLMQDWRRRWNNEALAFVIIQLPGFGRSTAPFEPLSPMAAVREAQAQAAAADRNAVAVSTLDLGDAELHPPRKLPLGRRAAIAAQRRFYGPAVPLPVPRAVATATITGNTISVDLSALSSCVTAPASLGRSVFVAGADGQWQPAEASLAGLRLSARAASVPRPVALRYAWADRPATPLLDCARDAPLPGFRTDNWAVARAVRTLPR
jgi:sialate O-acetylesterase